MALSDRPLADGTVHCAGSATNQFIKCFRLPTPNLSLTLNPNPKNNQKRKRHRNEIEHRVISKSRFPRENARSISTYFNVTRKLNLFLRKSIKLLPPELLLLAQICTKSFVGWGFAPDPTGGAYSAPPDPLAGLRGLLLRGGEGREGKGREVEGKGGDNRERKGTYS